MQPTPSSLEMGTINSNSQASTLSNASFLLNRGVSVQDGARTRCLEWIGVVTLMLIAGALEYLIRPHKQCIPGIGKSDCGSEIESTELMKPLREETISTSSLVLLVLFIPVGIFFTSAIYLHFNIGQHLTIVETPQNVNLDEINNGDIALTYFLNLKKTDGDVHSHNSKLDIKITFIQLERLFRLHCTALFLTGIFTDFIKVYVGAPRPNFYEIHESDDADDHRIQNIRMSFPSGHSSLIWCGMMMTFLLFWDCHCCAQTRANVTSMAWTALLKIKGSDEKTKQIAIVQISNELHEIQRQTSSIAIGSGQLSPLDINGDNLHFLNLCWYEVFNFVRSSVVLSVSISSIPLFIATFVSCTRIVDYWHHPVDVLAGAVIGIGVAVWIHSVFQRELMTSFVQA